MSPDTGVLSEKQRVIFDFVVSEVSAGRPFPGPRSVANHAGWKGTAAVGDVLAVLVRKGFLRADRKRNGGYANYKVPESFLRSPPQ